MSHKAQATPVPSSPSKFSSCARRTHLFPGLAVTLSPDHGKYVPTSESLHESLLFFPQPSSPRQLHGFLPHFPSGSKQGLRGLPGCPTLKSVSHTPPLNTQLLLTPFILAPSLPPSAPQHSPPDVSYGPLLSGASPHSRDVSSTRAGTLFFFS